MTPIQLPVFTRNPIMQAELRFQRRAARGRRWWRWLTRGGTLLAVMLALILYGGELAGALLQRDPSPIGEFFGVGVALLLVFTVALHFALMFRALALAANSIARERQGQTWDMLVLTGIDARQIVLGKWWATVRQLWRQYALLAVLRAGVIVWMAGSTSRVFTYIYVSGTSYYLGTADFTLPAPLDLLLAGVVVGALTLANLAFTAAVGVAASGEARSGALALARAIFMRAALLIVAAFLLLWLAGMLALASFPAAELPSRIAGLLLDNGAGLAGELAIYRSAYYGLASAGVVLPTALLGLIAYALLTWAVLMLAQRRAVRLRALPPVDNNRQAARSAKNKIDG
ncbi:MAG: hypothetical protein HZC41_08965 [Chloroflexi bacterium]|nr:hypothetical protein [Chloroflexota bacterium]